MRKKLGIMNVDTCSSCSLLFLEGATKDESHQKMWPSPHASSEMSLAKRRCLFSSPPSVEVTDDKTKAIEALCESHLINI